MDLYREEILEHWQNPQNFGVMDDADVVVEEINPVCGDEITMYFKISPDLSSSRKRGSGFPIRSGMTEISSRQARTIIREVRFTSSGCAISTASASILSEAIKGKKVNNIYQMQGKDVLKLIGGGSNFPPARLKCAFLVLEAIRKLTINI